MNATHEEWRPVVGYEGRYEVSSLGRIRSLDWSYTRADGAQCHHKGRMLNPTITPQGYSALGLSHPSSTRQRRYLLHPLILSAFVGPRPDGMDACHDDGNPRNNTLANLRWDTRSANCYDRVRHGRHWQTHKTHCPQGHELTPDNLATRVVKKGFRTCRTCDDRQKAKQVERRRLERQGRPRRKHRGSQSVLSDDEKRRIQDLHAAGSQMKDIARQFYVSQMTVTRVIRGYH